jgi:glycosyltransferase involved in cell wall biosynthesis
MNIAYLTADFGVHVFGYKGASIHVREMVAALHRAGHKLWVVSPAIGTTEGGEKLEHLDASIQAWQKNATLLHVLPDERHLQLFRELEAVDKTFGMKTRVRHELRNVLYNLTLYERLRDKPAAWKIDFIYERYALFCNAGLRLAREWGVPHLLEVNAPLAEEQEKMRGLEMKDLARAAERYIYQNTDRVLVVSENLKQFVASCGVPQARIHVLPNAVDAERFSAAATSTKIRGRYQLEGKHVIGFVGSLKPWHGTDTLVAAFAQLQRTAPHAHLLIVGEGPARNDLEQAARGLQLNGAITFTGNVPHEEIPHYVAAMDVTVAPYVPSEHFYFSPIKIFEYMVMAKPVVAGKIGQVEEIIREGENGVLFEPGNIAQLTAALAHLANDPELRRRLGESARAWVYEERTWKNNARKVTELAEEVRRST